MSIREIMSRILPLYAVEIDSYFFRLGTGGYTAGELHRGIDFNYTDSSRNINGQTTVFSPISGTVLRVDATYFGEVTIRRDHPDDPQADGTIHRILHLNTIAQGIAQGGVITAEQLLGTMGGRYATEDAVNGGYIALGPDKFPPHIHYDIYLPDDNGWQANDNRIDPIIYWTPAINPHSTDPQGNPLPSATGLHAFAIPVSDRDRNGTLDTTPGLSESAGVLHEGGASILQVGVNTPHTRSLALRIEFSERPAGFEAFALDGVESVTWQGNALLVTLAPTLNQATPNTGGFVLLSFAEESDNTNTASESLTYTVRVDGPAGNVFSAGPSRSLFLLDNDTPTPELDPAIARARFRPAALAA